MSALTSDAIVLLLVQPSNFNFELASPECSMDEYNFKTKLKATLC
eukprot:COSAG06_NODE_59891_length_272_cov_2.491329_1_plen_44_part_10